MERTYENIIILNSNIVLEDKIKKYLSQIGITEKYVCNKEMRKYTIIYYNDILKIITFELVNEIKSEISIDVYKNITFKYHETLESSYLTNVLELSCDNDKFILKADENYKAQEIKKLI